MTATQGFIWLGLTFAAYLLGSILHKRFPSAWSNPVLICPIIVIVILSMSHTDYSEYQSGTQYITFFLGPIELAMMIHLYKYVSVLKKHFLQIFMGVLFGTCLGAMFVIWMAHLFQLNPSTIASLTPKSVTAPMAASVSDVLGGLPELTAVFAMLTALIGMFLGPPIFKLLRIHNKVARGLALGTAASMVGAARAAEWGELEGAMGILGMVLSALFMAMLAPELFNVLF